MRNHFSRSIFSQSKVVDPQPALVFMIVHDVFAPKIFLSVYSDIDLKIFHCNFSHEEHVSNSTVQVLAGTHHKRKPESSHQIRDIAIIHIHPRYGSEGNSHDLALLELATELEYSDEILPVCLPRVEGLTDPECITTGWGATKRNTQS